MNEKCKGCNTQKGTFYCILVNIIGLHPDCGIECPCFECLVKVICCEQCVDRMSYFLQNIDGLKEKYKF